jgi:hypothetical protein
MLLVISVAVVVAGTGCAKERKKKIYIVFLAYRMKEDERISFLWSM